MNTSSIIHILILACSILLLVLVIFSALTFWKEMEYFAFRRVFFILTIPVAFFISYWFNLLALEIVFLVSTILFPMLFLFPLKTPKGICDIEPLESYDERDVMFSRKELIPESQKYLDYYKRNPQYEAKDKLFRKEPGLLAKGTRYYHEEAFKNAQNSFKKVDLLRTRVSCEKATKKSILPPDEIAHEIIELASKLGARDVGFTLLKNYHYYKILGRVERYGQKVENKHKFAIAFTVEMNHAMVMAAPQASIVMESAKQYLNSGQIAVKISEYLCSLGYDARAHIDGNYQLICPLVARDAGLGEIGRMGLLMTPKLGPRVRIALVSTNLELPVNKYEQDSSVLDFCLLCKKCADCCPSQSIEHQAPSIKQGVKRWKIDSESCFTYWNKVGTDCGRCMAVCPYSHPDNVLHNTVRFGIKHSRLFRFLALRLDDFIYGKRPKPHVLPRNLKN